MYKVLICEDEALERQVLRYMLANSKLPVEVAGEAANGLDAVKLSLALLPDIILMDIKMPGMDGLSAAKAIKEKNQAVEIVIITAYGKFSYSQQAIKCQVADYLLKPVRPEELCDTIKRIIARLEKQAGPAKQCSRNDKEIIERVKDLIQSNYTRDLTLAEAAAEVHLSPAYLSRIFKQKTKQSFSSFLTQYRLQQAQQLLIHTENTIDEIAYSVGYSNNSYFTAVFKKNTGLTPSEYRLRGKQRQE